MNLLYHSNMEEFVKADIFFVIASIAAVVVSALVAVALIYVIRIVRNVTDISERVRAESSALSQDLSELRASVRTKGLRLRQLVSFLAKVRIRTARMRRITSKVKE